MNDTWSMRLKLQECGGYETIRIYNNNNEFCTLLYKFGKHLDEDIDCSLVQICENGACKVDAI